MRTERNKLHKKYSRHRQRVRGRCSTRAFPWLRQGRSGLPKKLALRRRLRLRSPHTVNFSTDPATLGTQGELTIPTNSPHVKGVGGQLDFSGPRQLFCSLISPLSEEEFFNKHWEREPLLIKGAYSSPPSSPPSSSPLSSLFSLSTLRELVKTHPIRFGRHVNVCCYSNGCRRSFGASGERLAPASLEELWNRKRATVQFMQPQQFVDPLWHMLALLESYFCNLVGSNVYLTPSGSQGLAPHYDDVEVFILQLEGSKHWRLYPPSLPLPSSSSPDLSESSIGTPSHDLLLEPGDLLYFPRGTIHHADTPLTSSHSTHITISTYQQNTWGDLLSSALNSALSNLMSSDITFRRGLPHHLVRLPSWQNTTSASHAPSSVSPMSSLTDHTPSLLPTLCSTVLDWVGSNQEVVLSNHQQLFLATRLPPHGLPGPMGPIPYQDSLVYMRWPDHLLIVKAKQSVDLESGEGGRGRSVRERGRSGRGEEVIVYHSLANERAHHMVVMGTDNGPPQPRGIKFPLHFLPSLHLLLSSSPSSPLPSSSLPLEEADRHSLLLSLYAEGILSAVETPKRGHL